MRLACLAWRTSRGELGDLRHSVHNCRAETLHDIRRGVLAKVICMTLDIRHGKRTRRNGGNSLLNS